MLWDEARRLLVRQEAVLDTLRVQAVAVLSVTSIVAGLFGSRLIPGKPSGFSLGMVVAALILFAVIVTLVVAILVPRNWVFEHGLTDKLGMLERGDSLPSGDLAYSWAKGAEIWRATNKKQLDQLMCWFLVACALTGLEVIFWGLALL
jgi:hypothetical protein